MDDAVGCAGTLLSQEFPQILIQFGGEAVERSAPGGPSRLSDGKTVENLDEATIESRHGFPDISERRRILPLLGGLRGRRRLECLSDVFQMFEIAAHVVESAQMALRPVESAPHVTEVVGQIIDVVD